MDNRRLVFWCVAVFTVALELYGRTLPEHLFVTENLITTHTHFFWGLTVFLFIVVYRRKNPLDALLAVLVMHTFVEAAAVIGELTFFFDSVYRTVLVLLGALLGWGVTKVLAGEPTEESRLHGWLVVYSLALVPMFALGMLVSYVRGESADWFAIIWVVAAIPLTAWFIRSRRAARG